MKGQGRILPKSSHF